MEGASLRALMHLMYIVPEDNNTTVHSAVCNQAPRHRYGHYGYDQGTFLF